MSGSKVADRTEIPPTSSAADSTRRLSIVLPAFNEEANIVEAIARATSAADALCQDHEVIVVDDGSRDRTAQLVREMAARDRRIRLLQHERNLGYGEALRTGFQACSMDLVCFTDADNQFDLNELDRFLPWIDKVEVVAGYRLDRQDRLIRRICALGWNLLVRVIFYVPVRDIDCAFKLFRRYVFDSLDLESIGAMVNTEMMVKLGRSGSGVVEIPVTHRPRTAGQARGANPRVIARALIELVKMSGRLRQIDAGHLPAAAVSPTAPAALRGQPGRSRPSKGGQPVVVIGGGVAGCAAALRLARSGQPVVLLERSPALGGLVVSFSIGGTPIECFYHHIFPHEHDIIALIRDLGLGSSLEWHKSSTGVLYDGRVWPFTSPLDLLKFGPLPPVDRVQAGIGALRMRRIHEWEPLDDIPAADWLRSYCGEGASEVLWDPLLRAKFGTAAGDVPAAWMWGRINQRSAARRGTGENLGYIRGGFRRLFEALHSELTAAGVDVRTSVEVAAVATSDDRVVGVDTSEGRIDAGAVVYAGTLNGLGRLVPPALQDPRWSEIGSLGVLCVVLEMRAPLSDIYWTNVCDPDLPFGGIIEHTNLLPASDYDGRFVVYLSRYFTQDEDIAAAEPAAEAERWVDLLLKRFPSRTRDDILAVHPFRSPYAAPLMRLGHLGRIPPIESSVAGLFVTTTAQIYPQDRGMDEGIKAGYRVADVVINRIRTGIRPGRQ